MLWWLGGRPCVPSHDHLDLISRNRKSFDLKVLISWKYVSVRSASGPVVRANIEEVMALPSWRGHLAYDEHCHLPHLGRTRRDMLASARSTLLLAWPPIAGFTKTKLADAVEIRRIGRCEPLVVADKAVAFADADIT